MCVKYVSCLHNNTTLTDTNVHIIFWNGSTEYCFNSKITNITFHTPHSSQSTYLHSALHAHHSTRFLTSSSINLLSVPFVGTSLVPVVSVLLCLQSLTPALWMCTSLDTFHRHLKTHLAPYLLRLRLSFSWSLCTFTNYIYLLTYWLTLY